MTSRFQPATNQADRDGFTLVEMMVVITIIGLIAATVTMRFSGLTRRARFEWGVGQAINLDASARVYAKTHGKRVELQFEVGTSKLQRIYGSNQSDRKDHSLGESVTVRRFVSPTKDTSAGKVIVDYSTEGRSPTFAIEIKSQGSPAETVWLVFVGATGQVERQESEFEVTRLIKAVKAGNDAG